jgi:Family of unknown function (DUF5518)
MSNKLKASLIGGVLFGVLSAVTAVPQIPFIRLVCCLWAMIGGALAAYLYIKRSPARVGIGDGAIVGLLAGLFGALISFVAFLLVSFYITDRTLAEDQLRRAGLSISYSSIIFLIGILGIILQVSLSLVGGIIGVAIFEQREDTGTGSQPPPPPPPYSGGAYAPPPAPPPDDYGSGQGPGVQ